MIGIILAVVASGISILGVYANNILLDHVLAMLIWRWSNILFAGYFFGRIMGWWDGKVSDAVMLAFYIFCFITNEVGLEAAGVV